MALQKYVNMLAHEKTQQSKTNTSEKMGWNQVQNKATYDLAR